ncbi:hypothetical protein [Streptomyces sp. NPDC054837]
MTSIRRLPDRATEAGIEAISGTATAAATTVLRPMRRVILLVCDM